VRNMGPASLSSMARGFPLSAIGSGVTQPLLAGRSPPMYAVPPREMLHEEPKSALVEMGRETFPGDRLSVRSEAFEGSEETLSPNQVGTFLYGAPSEPLGSDVEPYMRPFVAKVSGPMISWKKVAMEILEFSSKVTDNLMKVTDQIRVDAVNREELQKPEVAQMRRDALESGQNLVSEATRQEELTFHEKNN